MSSFFLFCVNTNLHMRNFQISYRMLHLLARRRIFEVFFESLQNLHTFKFAIFSIKIMWQSQKYTYFTFLKLSTFKIRPYEQLKISIVLIYLEIKEIFCKINVTKVFKKLSKVSTKNIYIFINKLCFTI